MLLIMMNFVVDCLRPSEGGDADGHSRDDDFGERPKRRTVTLGQVR